MYASTLHLPAPSLGRRRSFAFLLTAVLIPLGGCGPGKTDISGTVTYSGRAIPWGRVSFISELGDKPVITSQIRNGHYEIKGIPVGPVKISVEALRAEKREPVPAPMAKGFKAPGASANDPPPEAIGKYFPIPEKYGNPNLSGLDYTITKGEQTHDIPLSP